MRNSLRGRFLLISVLLGLFVTLAAHHSERLVRHTYQQNRSALEGFYGLHTTVEDMKKATEELAAAVRGTTADTAALSEIGAPWAKAKTLAVQLAADSRIRDQPHFRGLGESLTAVAEKLDGESHAPNPRNDELARLTASLDRLIHLIERRMYDAVIDRTFAALDTSEVLSKLIWGLAATWMAVTLGGFMAFELVIRRPLLKMAEAMETEGRLGTFDTPLPAPRSQETATLVKAFASMRAQVQSRQMRLQSIIDNASDGIITLDENGVVRSMNPTAEMLFGGQGSTLADLLDKPVEYWPPVGDGEIITDFLRADGLAMQLSLKFSEYFLHDRPMYTVMVADVTERQALISKLTVQAERDALTGLYNRRFFSEEIGRAWGRSRRSPDARTALIAIDLDHFKFINDTFGHQAGDQLLIEIAHKLKKRGRQGDIIARLGGDEFAILLFDVDERSIEQVAQSYRLQVANHPFHCQGRTVEIGCSLGVAMLDASVTSLADWEARADLACRLAKSQGRNRHHLYQHSDSQNGNARLTEHDMGALVRRSVAEERFHLAYQPVKDLSSGVTAWHEVLVRMEDYGGGPLLPAAAFIADAERAGLGASLDRWVIRHALADLAAGKVPKASGGISINLSSQSLKTRDMLADIAAALTEHGITADKVIFEIAETNAVTNLAQVRDFMAGVKALGCATTIDGFGSGYSSFLYLRELPVDVVKLSGETVRQSATDAFCRALMLSAREIASALDCRIVAQWVENEELMEIVKETEFSLAQGYHFAPPRLSL